MNDRAPDDVVGPGYVVLDQKREEDLMDQEQMLGAPPEMTKNIDVDMPARPGQEEPGPTVNIEITYKGTDVIIDISVTGEMHDDLEYTAVTDIIARVV